MYYGEDFRLFTLDMFGLLRQDISCSLRNLLWYKRVYVERRRGISMRDALYQTAQVESSWTRDGLITSDA